MFAVGGFAMQFMVQGAWGVVPAHLNELSPPSVRAILPGFAYQLGNLAVSKMAPVQARLAHARSNDYALVLSWTIGIAAVLLLVVTLAGREAKGAELRVE
jgi:MFS transporter, SHS family, lactate transporter